MPRRIQLEDHTGNTSHQAKMSETAPVSRLIPAIMTAMELPITDDAGRPITYHLVYNSRQLMDDESLQSAGVDEGATLTIVPEMTAGSRIGLSDWFNWTKPPVLTLGKVVRDRRPVPGFPSFAVDQPEQRRVSVYLLRSILAEIVEHASLDTREVGGILTGEVYEQEGKYMVVVEGICRAQHVLSSCASLKFTGETWLDILKHRNTYPERKTLGWYHSHPGLSVFMSGVDEFTHQSFFGSQPWYIALVVDPVSGDLGAFTWEDGRLTRSPQIGIL